MNLVVIPARDEEATVGAVVCAVRTVMGDVGITVIDDGSRDATAQRAADAGATVVPNHGCHGYGAALITGFAHAIEGGYAAVATFDADGQHDAADLPKLFAALQSCDVVSASRYHPRSGIGVGTPPPERARLNREITERVNALTGGAITDAFCGLKVYRVDGLRRLRLDEVGYGFPLQVWVQAWRAGLVVSEVPVAPIYLPVKRVFGHGLDQVDERRAYYNRVLERALAASEPFAAGIGDG